MFVIAFAGIQLIPDGTLFIHIAFILLMIWILNRTFFRPINKILALREKSSGGKSTEAQDILAQVQAKNTSYDEAIRETRNEGYQLVEIQRAQSITKRQETIDSVKNEVASILKTEKDGIAGQTETARAEIATEANKLAEQISSNLLKV